MTATDLCPQIRAGVGSSGARDVPRRDPGCCKELAVDQTGRSFPLGATVFAEGANFGVFWRQASRVDLLLFDDVAAPQPVRVIELDPGMHRSYHYWHVPLTDRGRRRAERLGPVLAKKTFALVLVSPMQRARETCELAALGTAAVIDPDLVEWNYGEYEGLAPKQIQENTPGWLIFRDGCPAGETPEQVGTRADRVITRVRAAEGDVALFAHGHILRVLVARWIELPRGRWRAFPAGYGQPVRAWVLPRHSRREGLETDPCRQQDEPQ